MADVVAPVDDEHRGVLSRISDRARDALGRLTPWQVLFAAAVIGYVWYFTWVTLDYHHGLGTSAYDFGLYDQGTWLMSRFKAPFPPGL